jgi:asparagine synthase (glutamine-hydrolysing)
MCGIAGKISLKEPVDPRLIAKMCGTIAHRGPDSYGAFIEGGVGLGIQRLAIIDLETGDQPIFNEDRSVVVVLNGEIYNFQELRAQLSKSGHTFSTRSDTEVIVHLYEEYGDDCVRHLRGMFAFALWDNRRQRLLLARDRIGKKPLYYAFKHDCLWFGSEAKAILRDPAVPREVDYGAIDAFLQYQHVPSSYCAFSALSKLGAGHVLVFDNGTIQTHRYWKLSYEKRESESASDEEMRESIRSHLLEATRLRLRSDVPLGAFLSGGVDSSAVVAAMAQQVSGRVKTFTIGFPIARLDERSYAREIAEVFDTDHHEFVVEPDIVEMLPRLAWHYSEPFADQSAVPSFYLSEMTRAHVTVALNGDGGDESFGGYRRYFGNDMARRLERVPKLTSKAFALALARVGTGSKQDSLRARLLRLSRALQLDAPDRYAMWIACFDRREREQIYTHEFLARVRTTDVGAVVRDPYEASDAPTLIERLLDVDTQTFLADQLLVKMDVASMAESLEVRSPLLDQSFMEMAAGFPLSAKVSGATSKRLLKDAVRPWIPHHILDRPKQGFTMPIAEWLRQELRALPAAILLSPSARDRGLFRPEEIERLIIDHQRGATDNSNKLWALLQLELWFRTYIDRVPDGPVSLDFAEATEAGTVRVS